MALADSPAYEFSNAMTVGMSAPPIGTISSTPNSRDRPAKMGNIHVCSGDTISAIPNRTAHARTNRLTMFWPL